MPKTNPKSPATSAPARHSPSVTFADIEAAAKRIDGLALRTPVMTSQTVDERTGCQVFFKCENLQRGGAFKFRGAYNALSKLSPDERRRGVIAFSSGNHAQAIALAGGLLDIPRVVVMPDDAPAVKLAATRGYGAEIVLYNKHKESREEIGKRLAAERGLTLIPPFDHPDIIAGQGTATKELIEEVGPIDYLLVPVGGGGLISGSALAARTLAPKCRVIGVEPKAGDDATRSFHTKTLQSVDNPDTIADGARTAHLGKIPFPLILELVHDMATVSDAALVEAMFFLAERMKIIVEPTGILGAAALLDSAIPELKKNPGARVGVILSGGNVDLRVAYDLFRGMKS